MTRNCSVMSSCFASAPPSIRISRNPSWTINRLRSWSRNQSQQWSNLSNLAFVHTIIPLKLVHLIDQSSHSNTLGTWSLRQHCKNPLIYHWLRERNCFTGDLVKRKYRHPPSVAFIWSTKLGLKTSSEAREKLTLLNRIIALSSIEWNHSCIKCVNRTLRWCISMKLCSLSALSDRRDGRTTETEFASTIQI